MPLCRCRDGPAPVGGTLRGCRSALPTSAPSPSRSAHHRGRRPREGQVLHRRIVYVAIEREGIMGFAHPREWREAAIEAEPDKFVMPGGVDFKYKWLYVRMDAIDVAEMRELVTDAWSMVVPRQGARRLPRLTRKTADHAARGGPVRRRGPRPRGLEEAARRERRRDRRGRSRGTTPGSRRRSARGAGTSGAAASIVARVLAAALGVAHHRGARRRASASALEARWIGSADSATISTGHAGAGQRTARAASPGAPVREPAAGVHTCARTSASAA